MLRTLKSRAHLRTMIISAVPIALLISACASGSSSDSSGSSSKAPITILTMAPVTGVGLAQPEFGAAAKAATAQINAAGGLNGHHLNMILCDTQFNVNVEANCARKAVQSKVAAVVGGLALFPGTIAVLQQGNIPFIGDEGFVAGDYTSPISFPLSGGSLQTTGCLASMIADGFKHTSVILMANPTATLTEEQYSPVAKQAGGTFSATEFPSTATDLSPFFAKAVSGGANAIMVQTGSNDLPQAPQSLSSLHYTGAYGLNDSQLTSLMPHSAALKHFDGAYVCGPTAWPGTAVATPAVNTAVQAMAKYAPSTSVDGSVLQTWAAYDLFKVVVGKLPTVDAASVLNAFSHLKTPVETGIIGPYSVVGKSNHLYNDFEYTGKIENGVIVPMPSHGRSLRAILATIGASEGAPQG